jgi:hypothetical protein
MLCEELLVVSAYGILRSVDPLKIAGIGAFQQTHIGE